MDPTAPTSANGDGYGAQRHLSRRPLVTVGVATFNGAATVARTLESLEAQSYARVEVLISDDGSTDGTVEICEGFVARNSGWSLTSRRGSGGMMGNYRSLLQNARGELFCLVDQDDWRESDFLLVAVDALATSPESVGWVSSIDVVWDGLGGPDELDVVHVNQAPGELASPRPLTRVHSLLRRYVDGWYYGVFRTRPLREAFAETPSLPFFPAVILLSMVARGPLQVSCRRLMVYRGKGQAKRTTRQEDIDRLAGRTATHRVPFLVQQAAYQVRVCLHSSDLPPLIRLGASGLVIADCLGSGAVRIGYRLAKKSGRRWMWRLADQAADVVHPHDHIDFRHDPVATGYVARSWRAH